MKCITCSNILFGRQTKFCSRVCKNKDINNKTKQYISQKERGEFNKFKLLIIKGGQCECCGYNKNYSALCFHHLRDKKFALDIRQCSNRSWKTLLTESEKCTLLCHNCHMELHYPKNLVPPEGFEPPTKKL